MDQRLLELSPWPLCLGARPLGNGPQGGGHVDSGPLGPYLSWLGLDTRPLGIVPDDSLPKVLGLRTQCGDLPGAPGYSLPEARIMGRNSFINSAKTSKETCCLPSLHASEGLG